MRYKPYIGDVMDFLGMMMVDAPTFEDDFFIGKNIESVFAALNEGLNNVRRKVGEERYQEMLGLSGRMRAHFEADLEDKTVDAALGRQIIGQMQIILKST